MRSKAYPGVVCPQSVSSLQYFLFIFHGMRDFTLARVKLSVFVVRNASNRHSFTSHYIPRRNDLASSCSFSGSCASMVRYASSLPFSPAGNAPTPLYPSAASTHHEETPSTENGVTTPLESMADPWVDPLELQQRLRSVMVQLVLLSSPSTPLTAGDLVRLLLQPFPQSPFASTSRSSLSGLPHPVCSNSSFYVLDPLTRHSFMAANEAVRLYQMQSQQDERNASDYAFSTELSVVDTMTTKTASTNDSGFSTPPLSPTSSGAVRHTVASSASPSLVGQEPSKNAYQPSLQQRQEKERRYLYEAHQRISPSRWYAVGKEYVRLYDNSVLTLLKLEVKCQEEARRRKERGREIKGECFPNCTKQREGKEEDSAASEWKDGVPSVQNVLAWMITGLCLSDPFFRVIPSSAMARSIGSPPSLFATSPATTCSPRTHAVLPSSVSSPSVVDSHAIVYPLSSSMWLFTWDWNHFWLSAKAKWRKKKEVNAYEREEEEDKWKKGKEKNAYGRDRENLARRHVVLRPVRCMQAALQQYYSMLTRVPPVSEMSRSSSPTPWSFTSPPWTFFHSLYYLTYLPGVSLPCRSTLRSRTSKRMEEKGHFNVFRPSPVQLSNDGVFPSFVREDDEDEEDMALEWEVLFITWFEHVDRNLPDHLGDDVVLLRTRWEKRKGEKLSLPMPSAATPRDQEDNLSEAYRKWYKEMPHVGFRELLYGPDRLRQLMTSWFPTSSTTVEGNEESRRQRSSSLTPSTAMSTSVLGPPPFSSSFFGSVGSIRYLLHLFFVHKKCHQTSSGGGFYHVLERLNERLIVELGAYFLLAPISVSRLAAVLQWYQINGVGNTEISLFFREHSFLYFLLWTSGNPFFHRQHQRQAEAAVALDHVRAACGESEEEGDHEENEEDMAAIREEAVHLDTLYYKANVFTPPVTIELLAFFVLKWDMEEKNHTQAEPGVRGLLSRMEGNERKERKTPYDVPTTTTSTAEDNDVPPILLDCIRGVKLNTLYVVNTAYATPMEVWECLEQMIAPVASAAPAAHSRERATSRSSSLKDTSTSSVQAWARIEPFVWCAPYSLLKRRMTRVARRMISFRHPSSSVSSSISDASSWDGSDRTSVSDMVEGTSPILRPPFHAAPPLPVSPSRHSVSSFTIKEWAVALLWELEWGGGSGVRDNSRDRVSTACEMIWSLLALADPQQQHFQLMPPSNNPCGSLSALQHSCERDGMTCSPHESNSMCIGDWIVTIIGKND